MKYQQTRNIVDRQRLLREYEETRSEALDVNELAQILPYLPPPEPVRSLASPSLQLETNDLPMNRGKGVKYLVQLPPEFRRGRSYPVLIVLHGGGERPQDMIARCATLAGDHGYLLVAPAWESTVDGNYHYSTAEHNVVLDVLRDLRRRFPIDSDRVFLSGFAQGGTMAYDVGLSHPDLFAGILPLAGQPGPFATFQYWRNAQYLPYYVAIGDFMGEGRKETRSLFDEWIPRGYPMLWVEYKGRGVEWFAGELPTLFDWMNRKKRAHPLTELGRNPNSGPLSQEFRTMRSTDNRFYWLSTDSISERCLNEGSKFESRVQAATLHARIGEGNQVAVQMYGLKQLTVWFGRGMIDFDKPVTITVNLRSAWANRKIVPSLGVMMEDLYQRGDRQQLMFAKVELEKL